MRKSPGLPALSLPWSPRDGSRHRPDGGGAAAPESPSGRAWISEKIAASERQEGIPVATLPPPSNRWRLPRAAARRDIPLTGHRRILWLLLLATLTLPLRAQPSDDENKALAAAQQAFHDGAFDVVNDRVAALERKYPKSELLPQAELLQAQALYQLGRDDAAVAAFTVPIGQVPAPLQADTLFWQSEALLDEQKWPEAEAKFKTLLALRDLAGHAGDADLGLAWAVFKQGREAEAMPIIQNLIADKKNPVPAQHAQLLLAKLELAKNQFPGAIATLQALAASNPEPALVFQVNYWLGEAYAGNNQPDKAAAAYLLVTAAPDAFPKPLVAEANLGLGRAERVLGHFDLAATAYEKAYQLAENENARLDAFRAFLESAREAKQLPEAVATLQEYAKNSTDSAPAALFAIGLVLAEDGSEDKAIGTLESLLVAYSKSTWAAAANDQLGRLYARAGKPDLAKKALQACIDTSLDPALVRTARFQLGRVLYDGGDFAGAAAQFAQISDGTDALAEDASFNFLLTQVKLAKADAFLKAEADFTKRFPQSGYLKQIALAQGQLLTAQGKTADAMAAYERALGPDVATPDQKALLRSLASLQYQGDDLTGALVTNQRIIKLFPDDSLEASEAAVNIGLELKELTDDQAGQAFAALTQKYGRTPGGAEAYFKLGEFYSFRQDYVKAQDAFQQLTAAYPQSDYVDDAYFFAGQAAFLHQDYATAHALLEKVPDNSPFKPSARLWEGKAYQQQLNFSQAASVFDSVLATEKSGSTFVEASLLKGECLFEEKNYGAALDAFAAILKGGDGTVAQRNEAATRSAECLDKLGKSDAAMEMYLNVLYGRVAGDDPSGPQAPDFSWQVEAGVQAGMMRETSKDYRGAIEIYKRLEQIGGAHQQEFRDLINKLRRDNYIYE
jgi:tetratricopeptide (TPR) repeat protein